MLDALEQCVHYFPPLGRVARPPLPCERAQHGLVPELREGVAIVREWNDGSVRITYADDFARYSLSLRPERGYCAGCPRAEEGWKGGVEELSALMVPGWDQALERVEPER